MTIIKISPEPMGDHQNQTIYNRTPADFSIPEGYAVIPEEWNLDTIENFPFGEIEVNIIDGIPYVTKWTSIPKPEMNYEEPVNVNSVEQTLFDAINGI